VLTRSWSCSTVIPAEFGVERKLDAGRVSTSKLPMWRLHGGVRVSS